jgi:hypothetical protein
MKSLSKGEVLKHNSRTILGGVRGWLPHILALASRLRRLGGRSGGRGLWFMVSGFGFRTDIARR